MRMSIRRGNHIHVFHVCKVPAKVRTTTTIIVFLVFILVLLVCFILWVATSSVQSRHSWLEQTGGNIQSCQPRTPGVTSWYGISAYPRIQSMNESWEWVLHFTETLSINQDHEIHELLQSVILVPNVNSVRFTGVKAIVFEETFLKTHLNLTKWTTDVTAIPRYDCGYPKCVAKRRKLILRDDTFPPINGDITIIHGLITDVYDMKRIIAAISSATKVLITAITVYSSRVKEKEENFALQLYDFFHHVYFAQNWLPMTSAQYSCTSYKLRTRYGCELWVTWVPWHPYQPLRYIPPAGNGTLEMELHRLSSFINHPHTEACRTVQKFGGFRKSGSFIDGQYSVCLDTLRPSLLTNSCLVYSFGVSNDWTFDEEMHEAGCEVHSFDPSIGIPSHKRDVRHWFHAWGLTSADGEVVPGWDLASYGQIRDRLGHQGRFVNVVKMDVEGAEWAFLRDAMFDFGSLEMVDQFILEIHPKARSGTWMDIVRQRALMLHYLEKRGFVLFSTRQNAIGLDLRSVDYGKKLGKETGNFLYELSFMRPSNVFSTCLDRRQTGNAKLE